jgi:uncharacterized protein YwbE
MLAGQAAYQGSKTSQFALTVGKIVQVPAPLSCGLKRGFVAAARQQTGNGTFGGLTIILTHTPPFPAAKKQAGRTLDAPCRFLHGR